jgi:hypothetical protein
MSDLTVKRQYCEEHRAADHYVDENYHCHGSSLIEVESHGYTYARHIGGGWFRLIEKYSRISQQSLEWDLLADAHFQTPEVEVDF